MKNKKTKKTKKSTTTKRTNTKKPIAKKRKKTAKASKPKTVKKTITGKKSAKKTPKSTTRAKKSTGTNNKSKTSKKSTKKEALVLVPVVIKTHYDAKGGHPHVIVADVNQNHVSVGLTTDPYKGKNHKNYKLKVNPLGGSEQSYMRRQGTVDSKKRYKDARRGVMEKNDKAKAVQYGKKAQTKHKKGKKR